MKETGRTEQGNWSTNEMSNRTLSATRGKSENDKSFYNRQYAMVNAQLGETIAERDEARSLISATAESRGGEISQMMREAAQAMKDWSQKEKGYMQMIANLEEQVRSVKCEYGNQWQQEKQAIISECLASARQGWKNRTERYEEELTSAKQQRNTYRQKAGKIASENEGCNRASAQLQASTRLHRSESSAKSGDEIKKMAEEMQK